MMHHRYLAANDCCLSARVLLLQGPVMPPPQAVHAPGDMLEQLDFLVAQQQSQQSQEVRALQWSSSSAPRHAISTHTHTRVHFFVNV